MPPSSSIPVPAPRARKAPFFVRLEHFLLRHLNTLIPKTRWGDYFVSLVWFLRMHRRFPRRDALLFNDVLFRIKTTSAMLNPLRGFTSDKELLKHYVAAKVGHQFNVPTLAVLKTPEEVARFDFPPRCVIKPTHVSGFVILRRAGEPIDLEQIRSWFEINYYDSSREVNYRYLEPKVIVEPFVFDNDNPNDYKFFCARGEPGLVQIDADRKTRHVRCFYDTTWRKQPYSMTYPLLEAEVARPANLELMIELARKLSADFNFVRVDFYSDGTNTYVGELTHCHGNAREFFEPRSAELEVSRRLFGSDAG